MMRIAYVLNAAVLIGLLITRPVLAEEDLTVSALLPGPLVTLVGDWPDEARLRLHGALARAVVHRPSRVATEYEMRILYTVRFVLGDAFRVEHHFQPFANPAAIYGGGISGSETQTITLPRGATEPELGAYLATKLPGRLVRNEAFLARRRKELTAGLRGWSCNGLLSRIGLARN